MVEHLEGNYEPCSSDEYEDDDENVADPDYLPDSDSSGKFEHYNVSTN